MEAQIRKLYKQADALKRDLMREKHVALAYMLTHTNVSMAELKRDKPVLMPLLWLILRMGNIRKDRRWMHNLWRLNHRCNLLISSTIRNYIAKRKLRIIADYINSCRKEGRYYYLCSSHDDCALDHENYQGLIYRDNACPGAYYLSGYRDIQWVMDHPVYMITRPYCRHYFVGITYDEAKQGNIEALKRKYRTHTRIGNRKFRTPAVRNTELYRDRLQLLKRIYKIEPSLDIKKQILKTEMLLKKWESK